MSFVEFGISDVLLLLLSLLELLEGDLRFLARRSIGFFFGRDELGPSLFVPNDEDLNVTELRVEPSVHLVPIGEVLLDDVCNRFSFGQEAWVGVTIFVLGSLDEKDLEEFLIPEDLIFGGSLGFFDASGFSGIGGDGGCSDGYTREPEPFLCGFFDGVFAVIEDELSEAKDGIFEIALPHFLGGRTCELCGHDRGGHG